MGNIIRRLFAFPVKDKPISFHRQSDFTSTGVTIERDDVFNLDTSELNFYDRQRVAFYEGLHDARANNEGRAIRRTNSLEAVLRRYPGWNEFTIATLHSLFLVFLNTATGMVGLHDLCSILDTLGDQTSPDVRREKFLEADLDADGYLHYDEFLTLMYVYDAQTGEKLMGLAQKCVDAAAVVNFVQNLSLGEQLEYALY